ncbi:hypothetical protein IWZ01DRAFT_520415 [Phyllosticta capitalensis]
MARRTQSRSPNPTTSSSSSSGGGITPILPLLLLLALATLSTRLFSLPLNRVIEARYCTVYYDSPTPPPESQCKVDWVQTRLAWLQGVIETAVICVDLGVAVPAAWVGDRWRKRGRGRRVVLAANLVGWAGVVGWVVIVGHLDGALPVSAMAAAPFFALIGGHDCVLNSAVFAIVTDLTDDLVQRTSYIAYISSVNYVVSLFGPSLASAAMTVNLWLPFYLSIGFLIAALPVVYFLPLKGDDRRDENTAPSAATKDGEDPEAEPLLNTASTSSSSPSWSPSSSQPQPLLARFLHLLHRRPRFLLLLSSFLLTSLASSNTHLLPQYMSARYHRSFASVGPLLSLKAVTNIALLTFVVPVGMRVLLRRHHKQHNNEEGDTTDVEAEGYGASSKNHNPATIALNINAALLSLAVSVLGALAIAAAPRVAWLVCALLLYALGSALPVFTMALVEATASTSGGTARVYTVVMAVKTIGTLVGAPLMTAVWVVGINLNDGGRGSGAGLGLPYYVSAVLYLCAMGVVWCLKL